MACRLVYAQLPAAGVRPQLAWVTFSGSRYGSHICQSFKERNQSLASLFCKNSQNIHWHSLYGMVLFANMRFWNKATIWTLWRNESKLPVAMPPYSVTFPYLTSGDGGASPISWTKAGFLTSSDQWKMKKVASCNSEPEPLQLLFLLIWNPALRLPYEEVSLVHWRIEIHDDQDDSQLPRSDLWVRLSWAFLLNWPSA